MDLLFIISTPEAKPVLLPMAAACRRKGLEWGYFFTNDGVKVLGDQEVVDAVHIAEHAVVCEHSWARFMGEADCPITLGSQTQNSVMVGTADHIVSL